MRIIILISLFIFNFTSFSIAETNSLIIKKLSVVKRNKPGCYRLGNIYGYCQWMVKLTLRNKSEKSLNSFCSILNVNKKRYEICYGINSSKTLIKANKDKTILINLKDLINYDNDAEMPNVYINNVKAKFK
mgnify:CR=1 FL=1